jgi:hypothetical protein
MIMSIPADLSIDDETLIFLDFDGVVCDSINECCATSSIAYYEFYKGEKPVSLPRRLKTGFSNLRPLVRRGEDYLFIQEIIEQGIAISGQEDFDDYCGKGGEGKAGLFGRLFYKARSMLLREDRKYWMSLNPIYAHMFRPLRKAISSPRLYIISTKRRDFIRAIFQYWKISVRPGHVIDSGREKKLSIISAILDKRNMKRAIFVEDQIDHLVHNPDERIVPLLAVWGYIQKEWCEKEMSVITEEEMAGVLSSIRD